MFRQLTKICIFSLSALALLILLFMGWPRKSDFRAYRAALELSKNMADTAPPVCQNRRLVCKDIWFSQDNFQRLHYRIESTSSSLNLQHLSKKLEAVERLHDMRCWMQDKIVPGESQQSRYFTANEGVYHFLSQSLFANQATLSLYRLQGELLPGIGNLPKTLPFLSGKAEQIKMHVSGKAPLFQAHNFQASMNNSSE